MQSKAPTIVAYLRSLEASERAVIAALDDLIRAELPTAVASMKFGMPTYEFGGRMLACNAQKNYFSFYLDPAIVKAHRVELRSLSVGKSCIRFRKLDPSLIETFRKIVTAYARA
jgi:uncharacterized protein YdhG (YjbR/CyaY superfamily)